MSYDFPLRWRFGFSRSVHDMGTISLDVGSVGHAASYAGSYHILAMGRHYDEYVVAGSSRLGISGMAGLPAAHPYKMIGGKVRASGVTGNIGEAVTGIVARRVFGLAVSEIGHLNLRRPGKRRKTPDFVLRFGSRLASHPHIAADWPRGLGHGPEWWPVESKARNTPQQMESAIAEGFKQLLTYWHILAASPAPFPDHSGFGCVCVFIFEPPENARAWRPGSHQVLIAVFAPRDQGRLVDRLRGLSFRDVSNKNFDFSGFRDDFHGRQ